MAQIDYPAILAEAWRKHLAPRGEDAPTVISTFAGAGGSSLGYSMAGYRELLAVEWDDNAVETFRLNFPGVPIYHNDIAKLSVEHCMELAGITEPGQLDVLDGSPPCFPAGFQVSTLYGKIPIDFCTTDTQVLTHTGKFKKVIHTMQKKYRGQLYTIEIKYGRKPIDCTPEHLFFARKRVTLKRDSATRKNSTSYKAYLEPEWIKAEDLSVGDVILEPHQKEFVELDIPKIIKKQRINIEGQSGVDKSDYKLIESACAIEWQTIEIAWLLGFYLAEGHTRGHNPTFNVNGPCRREVIYSVADKEAFMLAEKLQRAGFNPQVQKHSKGASRVTITSIDFWALCQTVGKYADGKFVPAAFMCQPVEWQSALLDGYFSGDGCIVKSKRVNSSKQKATTVSWDLAIGIAKMVACVHKLVASIEVLYPAGMTKIEGRTVTVKEAYSVGYTLPTSNRVRPGFVDDYGAWLPIKNISIKDVDTTVYNLEVEDDNSYTVEDIAVHNCQGFSTAGKRIIDDDRNQLFREFVRLLRGLKPKVFVMENVSGMVKGKMKLVFAEILRELRASGYRVKARKLNAMYFYVPQSRERIIFIGVREDLGIEPGHPKAESRPVTVREAIKDAENYLPHSPDYNTKLGQCCKLLTPGQNGEALFGKNWGFQLIRLVETQPSPTISKDGGATGFIHPSRPTKINGGELKRLASFPDMYQFLGSRSFVQDRIGNSVPPLFMRSIANHIRQTILTNTRNASGDLSLKSN